MDTLVLDCGSTGCRLHIFKQNDKQQYYALEIGEKLPALPKIISDNSIKNTFIVELNKLIESCKDKTHEYYVGVEPKLFVGITAGVRNLDVTTKNTMMQSVNDLFKAINVKLVDEQTAGITIMTDDTESDLEKTAVGYILENCQKEIEIPADVKNGTGTVGHIGMGGGSIQISINSSTKPCDKSKSKIKIPISFTNDKYEELLKAHFKDNKYEPKLVGTFYAIEAIWYVTNYILGEAQLGIAISVKDLLTELESNSLTTFDLPRTWKPAKIEVYTEYIIRAKQIFIELLKNIFDENSKIITMPENLCQPDDKCSWALGYFIRNTCCRSATGSCGSDKIDGGRKKTRSKRQRGGKRKSKKSKKTKRKTRKSGR